jgi:protein ImuA
MSPPSLKTLTDRIREIEARGRGVHDPQAPAVPTPLGTLPRRTLHEWFGEAGPPLCLLTDLAVRAMGEGGAWIAWIGRSGWPHPHLLARRHPAAFERSLLIDPPARDRVWASDLVLRCEAIGAAVIDGAGLDMAASRRLQLAAEAGRALALIHRPQRELAQRSVAAYRWAVQPTAREGIETPCWAVSLLRCKDARHSGRDASPRVVKWSGDAGLVGVPAAVADRPAASARRIAG